MRGRPRLKQNARSGLGMASRQPWGTTEGPGPGGVGWGCRRQVAIILNLETVELKNGARAVTSLPVVLVHVRVQGVLVLGQLLAHGALKGALVLAVEVVHVALRLETVSEFLAAHRAMDSRIIACENT